MRVRRYSRPQRNLLSPMCHLFAKPFFRHMQPSFCQGMCSPSHVTQLLLRLITLNISDRQKLETLEGISEKERDDIQTLAVKIFVSNAPTDPVALPEPYIKCLEVGKSFKACILSGRYVYHFEFSFPLFSHRITLQLLELFKTLCFTRVKHAVFHSSSPSSRLYQ